MKPNQWKAALFATLLFASGVISGLLVERYLAASVVNAKTSEDFRQQYTSEMRAKLRLTNEQVNQLEVLLDETKAQYKGVRDQYRPQMLKIKNEQVNRVKSILTQQQVPAYEKLVADRERRFKEQEERDHLAEAKREAAHRAHVGQ